MRMILCPHCSEPYSLFLFEFGIPFWCRCGYILGAPEELTKSPEGSSDEHGEEISDEYDAAEEEDFLFDDYADGPPFYDDISHRPMHYPSQEVPQQGDFSSQFEARVHGLGNQVHPEAEAKLAREQQKMGELHSEELRRRADRICFLISSTDYSRAEIEVEQHILKVRCQRYFPEMREAYQQVYEPRFDKLWHDFREE